MDDHVCIFIIFRFAIGTRNLVEVSFDLEPLPLGVDRPDEYRRGTGKQGRGRRTQWYPGLAFHIPIPGNLPWIFYSFKFPHSEIPTKFQISSKLRNQFELCVSELWE